MNSSNNHSQCWAMCHSCQGTGRIARRVTKKAKRKYQKELNLYNSSNKSEPAPKKPKGHVDACTCCAGNGLIPSNSYPDRDYIRYPHIAIIGAGIAGIALAVACRHRGIPFTIYERDNNFDSRAQGYGLTLQQASKAIKGLGIQNLEKGVISTRHVIYTTDGKIIGEWGIRDRKKSGSTKELRRTNIHIARQSLRAALLAQLGGSRHVQWDHQLVNFDLIKTEQENEKLNLQFKIGDKYVEKNADILIGADGIRSRVRNILIDDEISPLNYLGCMVVLGICQLDKIKCQHDTLLDSATVFQTVNGRERIYVMPYSAKSVMWQLSFPVPEYTAANLSKLGSPALKEEARRRCDWHKPIPEIINATETKLISGYPIYDRNILSPDLLNNTLPVSLIGDAAHPMSPFKGQGANQAILDGLSLARHITQHFGPCVDMSDNSFKKRVLKFFEAEMTDRTAVKVHDSARVADILHSKSVLKKNNYPRGNLSKFMQS